MTYQCRGHVTCSNHTSKNMKITKTGVQYSSDLSFRSIVFPYFVVMYPFVMRYHDQWASVPCIGIFFLYISLQISCWIAPSSYSLVAQPNLQMANSVLSLCLTSRTRRRSVRSMPKRWWVHCSMFFEIALFHLLWMEACVFLTVSVVVASQGWLRERDSPVVECTACALQKL